MPDPRNPDIWHMVFEQTPPAIRWVFGVLTFGVFTLLSVIYKWSRDDMQKVYARMDHLEATMEKRHAETNRLLFQIARNTDPGTDECN